MKATNLMKQLDVQTQALAHEQVKILGEAFIPILDDWDRLHENYNDIILKSCTSDITPALSKAAKAARLKMSKVRTTTEKIRKQQKEEYLRTGQAIDGLATFIKKQLQPMEEKLKEVENYEEIQKQQKIAQLQTERLKVVYDLYSQFNIPISETLINTPYGEMHPDVFEGTLQVLKSNLEKEQHQIKLREQEEKATQEREVRIERLAKQEVEKALKVEQQRIAELTKKLELEEAALKSKDEENARQRYLLRQKVNEDQERKEKEELVKADEKKKLDHKQTASDKEQICIFWREVLHYITTNCKAVCIKDYTLDDMFQTNVQAFKGKIQSEIDNWESKA